MPSSLIAADRMNGFIAISNPDGRSTASDALSEAASCREAVDLMGVFDGVDPELLSEIHAVLDALPPAVDQALLAAHQSVLNRGVDVSISWEEGSPIGLRIEEDGENGVRVVLITPDGREFTSQ